jgi:hypothetical protein
MSLPILLPKKKKDIEPSLRSGRVCDKFMFDCLLSPSLDQPPKVISEMITVKSLAFHITPQEYS